MRNILKKFSHIFKMGLLITSSFTPSSLLAGIGNLEPNDIIIITPQGAVDVLEETNSIWYKLFNPSKALDMRMKIYEMGVIERKEALERFIRNANFWEKEIQTARFQYAKENWERMSTNDKKEHLQTFLDDYIKSNPEAYKKFNNELIYFRDDPRFGQIAGCYDYDFKKIYISENYLEKHDFMDVVSMLAHEACHMDNDLNRPPEQKERTRHYKNSVFRNHTYDNSLYLRLIDSNNLFTDFFGNRYQYYYIAYINQPTEHLSNLIGKAVKNQDFSIPSNLLIKEDPALYINSNQIPLVIQILESSVDIEPLLEDGILEKKEVETALKKDSLETNSSEKEIRTMDIETPKKNIRPGMKQQNRTTRTNKIKI